MVKAPCQCRDSNRDHPTKVLSFEAAPSRLKSYKGIFSFKEDFVVAGFEPKTSQS